MYPVTLLSAPHLMAHHFDLNLGLAAFALPAYERHSESNQQQLEHQDQHHFQSKLVVIVQPRSPCLRARLPLYPTDQLIRAPALEMVPSYQG
jgi:hypothetical protein